MNIPSTPPKSFYPNVVWGGRILLILGFIFIGISIFMTRLPIYLQQTLPFYDRINQPAIDLTTVCFRFTAIVIVASLGIATAFKGFFILLHDSMQRRFELYLRETGGKVYANIVDCIPYHEHENHKNTVYLLCSCLIGGKVRTFRSDPLCQDPTPYLPKKQVIVYYDRCDLRYHFVDIDRSTHYHDNRHNNNKILTINHMNVL